MLQNYLCQSSSVQTLTLNCRQCLRGIYKTIRCHIKMPQNDLCHSRKQFLSTPTQRGTSQAWHFQGVSLLLLSTWRQRWHFSPSFVAFLPASVTVSMGREAWLALLLRGTPALSMPRSWHTSSITKSLCAMGCILLALLKSRCKMNAFVVAISKKCSNTVLCQRAVFLWVE